MKIKIYHFLRGSEYPDERWELHIEDNEIIRIIKAVLGSKEV